MVMNIPVLRKPLAVALTDLKMPLKPSMRAFL